MSETHTPAAVDPTLNLPRYRSHKVVNAGKIIALYGSGDDQRPTLELDAAGFRVLLHPSMEWMKRLPPNTVIEGGWYVRYEDGYESWSPAAAFENGYVRCDDRPAEVSTRGTDHPIDTRSPESLLMDVSERLEAMQKTPLACEEYRVAGIHVQRALMFLNSATARVAQATPEAKPTP